MKLETLTKDIGENHSSLTICRDVEELLWDQEERTFEELVNEGEIDYFDISSYDLGSSKQYTFFKNP